MSATRERRFTDHNTARLSVEQRDDGKRSVIAGYGAVFYSASDAGTEYRLWDDFRERIMPGAFDRALRDRHDVRGLFNHDANQLLGRSAAGTMRLSVDQTGLRYEIDLPDTQLGRDLRELLERGDITGSSFAFAATRVVWIEERDLTIRQVEEVDLYDVGPVTFPAYEATTAGVRSEGADDLRREAQQFLQRHTADADEVEVRLRLLALDLGGEG